jgi:hypothetical protein
MGMFKHYTGNDLGQDFKSFYLQEKKKITKELTAMGCTQIEMSRQFYYFFGFFTAPNGQVYYFSISDIRHFHYKGELLVRTARDYKDFSGGQNQYIQIEDLNSLKLR